MPHYQFPCHYVYWDTIVKHESLKSKILPKIYNHKNVSLDTNPFNACKVNTSIEHDFKFLDNEDINEIVWKSIGKMLHEINSKYNFKIVPKDSFINGYWYNMYEKGDFQEHHNHSDEHIIKNGKKYYPCFSVIYILHDKNNTNSTVFKHESAFTPFTPMFDNTREVLDTSIIKEIKEGSVIIFSSHLDHLVKPTTITGRVTIAFNIFSTF